MVLNTATSLATVESELIVFRDFPDTYVSLEPILKDHSLDYSLEDIMDMMRTLIQNLECGRKALDSFDIGGQAEGRGNQEQCYSTHMQKENIIYL